MKTISTQTDLGRKMRDYVQRMMTRQFDRRRVVQVRDDGRAETVSYDPELVGEQPVPMTVPLGMPVYAGDDVICVRVGGGWIVAWVVATFEPEDDRAEIGRITPIGGMRFTRMNHTVLNTYGSYLTVNLDLPAGTYRAQAMGYGIVANSHNTGVLGLRLAISNTFTESAIGSGDLAVNQRTPLGIHCDAEFTLESPAEVPVELGFMTSGLASGGQISMYHGIISGTYQRIG